MMLTEFLSARLAEDDAVARSADRYDVPRGPLGVVADTCGHTLAIDPARVLAECEAKRRLVAWCEAQRVPDDEPLLILALPYATHPDYRQEWKL